MAQIDGAKPAEQTPSGFNFHDPLQMQDPFPFYAATRAKCPVAHSDELGGFYYAPAFETTREVLSDFRTFSSAEGTALPKQPMLLIPEDLDPPLQTKYRKLLNPRFTPEHVAQYRERLQGLVDGYIDEFIETGHAELLGDLVRPTLAFAVLPMLGVPTEDRSSVSEKVDYVNRNRVTDPEGAQARGAELGAYLMALAAGRRTAERQDDILQLLVDAEIDGAPLNDGQIFSALMLLLFGGLDTTTAVMGEGLLHLGRHPEDAARLRSGEAAWRPAIEEFVRYGSPLQALRRTVRRETELAGQRLCPGDYVMAMNGAANRDPTVFDRPDEIIIDRKMDQHLGFGAGAHICLGQNFARLAIETVLSTVIRRLPDFAIEDEFHPVYAVGEARGMKELPVTFTPGTRSEKA